MMRITCLFIAFSQYVIMIAEGPLNCSMSTIISYSYKGEYFKSNPGLETITWNQCLTGSAQDVLRTLTLYTSIHAPKKVPIRNIIVRNTGM